MLMAERSGAGTAEDLDGVIADLRALSEDIESCAVLSGDGDLLSSSHAPGVERERVGAILAALVDLSERLARESGKGQFSQLRIDAGGTPAGRAARWRRPGCHDGPGSKGRPRALRHAKLPR